MDRIRRHAAVTAKIKALEGRFLTDGDYISLLRMKTVTECAGYLKENTSYSKVLAEAEIHTIHREALEGLIKQRIIENMDRIMHYYSGSYRDFIRTFYAKYEIEDLKDLAREVYNKKEIKNYEDNVFVGKFSKVEPRKVFEAKSARDIIQALSDTAFSKYLCPLLDENKGENLFRFEMALDMAYYSILRQEWDRLAPADQETIRHAFGIFGDILNIQWIYRGKKFYGIKPEILLNYTIKLYYRLNFKQIKELCYEERLSDFLDKARETEYGFLFKEDETTDIFMDRRMYRYLYFKLKSLDKNTSMNIINAVAYILLLEFEVRDIISIIEIIRYQVPEDQGKKYLIKKLSKGAI